MSFPLIQLYDGCMRLIHVEYLYEAHTQAHTRILYEAHTEPVLPVLRDPGSDLRDPGIRCAGSDKVYTCRICACAH